jgi:glycosyltransferase involved in cell wall biosynthesis
MGKDVSIIIPVYNGGETFSRCLAGIKDQDFPGKIDLVIVDSGSTDGSVEVSKRAGAKVSCIENKDFHHSRTRNSALQLTEFEKIVYLVQDAIPVSTKWLSQLCAALDQEDVASVSVRQIPHVDADAFSRFEVEFHGKYLGNKPYLKYVESPDKFNNLSYDDALHKIRHDNVCSIYRRNLLERYPFPDVEFAEDMAWAHAMLLRGYKILYDPRIIIRHSHNRPPEYRFRRSIVDSIACAKILGMVKEDISYLSVTDLSDIKDNIENFSSDLKKKLVVQTGLCLQNIDIAHYYLMARKYILFLKKVRHLLNKIMYQSEKDCHSLRLQQAYCNRIRFVISMITAGYTLSSAYDRMYCIDQITATALGMLYGELYSGHMLKGVVPREVEDLVRPYLGKV